jgi:hypothetical protein
VTVRIIHRLTGYDRATELLTVEHEVPIQHFPRVRKIARVGADDPDAIGSYPLDRVQAQLIARVLGTKVDPGSCDFFLEPFAEP